MDVFMALLLSARRIMRTMPNENLQTVFQFLAKCLAGKPSEIHRKAEFLPGHGVPQRREFTKKRIGQTFSQESKSGMVPRVSQGGGEMG